MKPRSTLATWLGSLDGARPARVLETRRDAAAAPGPRSLGELADHALVWPDGAEELRMAGPLRQAWDTPPGLDAQLEELLAGAASDELRGMLAALGITPPGGTSQRLAALVEHHGDRPVWPPRWRSRCAGPAGTPRSSPSRLPRDRSPPPPGGDRCA